MVRRLLIYYSAAFLLAPLLIASLMAAVESGCSAAGKLCPGSFRPLALLADVSVGATMLAHFGREALRGQLRWLTVLIPAAAVGIAVALSPIEEVACQAGSLCLTARQMAALQGISQSLGTEAAHTKSAVTTALPR